MQYGAGDEIVIPVVCNPLIISSCKQKWAPLEKTEPTIGIFYAGKSACKSDITNRKGGVSKKYAT